MTLQTFSNKLGSYISPMFNTLSPVAQTTTTVDAVGESQSAIGYITLEGGPGSSKTISSAGGKVHWRTGNGNTFANAGTTLRIGLQDVAATGLEDGTFDVNADLVGGVATITNQTFISTAMTTGTKTVAHGDLVAVVFEMTARAGVDSVTIARPSLNFHLPYGTADTGTLAKTPNLAAVTVEFDDGTVGWFHPFYAISGTGVFTGSTTSFNSGSTPDERAMIFRLPFPATISGMTALIDMAGASSDFEMILYSDPLGTPVAQRTTTIDVSFADVTAGSSNLWGQFATTYDLSANTDYALSIRPTTANNVTVYQLPYGATNLMKPTTLGTNWYLGTRTNQTGAFSTTSTTIPMYGMFLSQFQDATGGGTVSPKFIIGG